MKKALLTFIIICSSLCARAQETTWGWEKLDIFKGNSKEFEYYRATSTSDTVIFVSPVGYSTKHYFNMGMPYYRILKSTKSPNQVIREFISLNYQGIKLEYILVYIYCNLSGTVDFVEFEYEYAESNTKIIPAIYFEFFEHYIKDNFKISIGEGRLKPKEGINIKGLYLVEGPSWLEENTSQDE